MDVWGTVVFNDTITAQHFRALQGCSKGHMHFVECVDGNPQVFAALQIEVLCLRDLLKIVSIPFPFQGRRVGPLLDPRHHCFG